MSEFLSIREAIKYTGKSESTIRRYIRKTDQRHLQKEVLENGAEKWFIPKSLLDNAFNTSPKEKVPATSQKETSESPSSSLVERLIDEKDARISDLKSQINDQTRQNQEKDKQIEDLLTLNREYQLILDRVNEALLNRRVPELIEADSIDYDESNVEETMVNEAVVNDSAVESSEDPVESNVDNPKISNKKSQDRKEKLEKHLNKQASKRFSDWLKELS